MYIIYNNFKSLDPNCDIIAQAHMWLKTSNGNRAHNLIIIIINVVFIQWRPKL